VSEHGDENRRTIRHLLERRAESQPYRFALVDAVSGLSLSYAELLERVDQVGSYLSANGASKELRVCTAFPNGIGAAIAFLGTSSVAQCVPLNSASTKDDLAKQIDMIGPKILMIDHGLDLRSLELQPDIPVIRVSLETSSPVFDLSEAQVTTEGMAEDRPGPNDIAAIVQTSGSTAAPKLVPLKHSQMLTNASHFASALELCPDDRCLNVMQMHHVGGLQGTMLATLQSGGTTICTPGFSATEFTSWLRDFRPTWFEAVPTMLNALAHSRRNSTNELQSPELRMVRSSSSALSPALLADIERMFNAPVIEAYGMSEAGLMAINQLVPGERRPGSVGKIIGDSVKIVDSENLEVGVGVVGEIVARGSFVIESYAEGGDLSQQSFSDAGFHTGDLGFIDEDGYLTLAGRSKEMVNRGGENIGLREIDEALELHPSVELAAAFGVPHPQLGEEVVAAVVIKGGAKVTPAQLRMFLSQLLAWAKIPKRIFIKDSLPMNDTGKIERRELAAEFRNEFE
jgi:acyl-CoA synthetase (AMP-forming)/AMP-acid ligase II